MFPLFTVICFLFFAFSLFVLFFKAGAIATLLVSLESAACIIKALVSFGHYPNWPIKAIARYPLKKDKRALIFGFFRAIHSTLSQSTIYPRPQPSPPGQGRLPAGDTRILLLFGGRTSS